ncbi:MAG: amidohydrolase family protein [bacterium]|nr:amidohydrolase family protein [bacterium]
MPEHYEIPLLNDSHNHTSFYMILRNCLDVRNVDDIDKAIEMIRSLSEDINVVLGWRFGNKKRDEIEKLAPLLICDGSLHSYIMNKKAKNILKDKFPVIVENIENLDWIEHNLYSIIKFIPQIKAIELKDVFEFFEFMLIENQIYSMEDLLLPNTDFIKMYEDAGFAERVKYWVDVKSYEQLSDEYRNKVNGLKIFLDGAIGPETAALNGYINIKSNGGIKLYSNDALTKDLKYAEKEGKAVAAHALGELVIEQLIDIVEKENINLPYLRIEHAQYISLEMAKKCKKLGIILSMQVNFSRESLLFKHILIEEYLKRNNPFRMLIDECGFVPGKDLIFGSDGMPHGAQSGLENALFPVYDSQKLTLDEFVKGYCVNSYEHGKISFDIENDKIINLKTII